MFKLKKIAVGIAQLFVRVATCRRVGAVVVAVVMCFGLAACGGGGGSSRSSAAPAGDMPGTPPTANPGTTPGDQNPGTQPGNPSSGSGSGVAVPNSLIPNAGTGTRDSFYADGCTGADCYDGNIKADPFSEYPDGLCNGYRCIQGASLISRSIGVPNPPQDVRDAWRDGWTGQGLNVLIIDDFGGPEVGRSAGDTRGTHGYTVAMSALEIASEANFLALEGGFGASGRRYGETYIPPGDGAANPGIRIDVVNLSFGRMFPETGYPSDSDIAVWKSVQSNLYSDLTGAGTAGARLTGTGNSVIVKAAGNGSGVDASRLLGNAALVRDTNTGPRTLIVGALDNYARASTSNENSNVSTAARIASYSDLAGARTDMQSRFLVEYGGTPYGETAWLCNSNSSPRTCGQGQVLDTVTPFQPGGSGTSYAAPRVAGFAALVRDKFPGLSGAQTAEILLDTATTVGLACHTGNARKSANCSRAIYGQGRVSIGDALSPRGKLD